MSIFDIRRSDSRGALQLDWLDARFSFSFGPYRDSSRNGFGPLVTLNEDVIQPGTGFDMHPHENMEIFIIPLSGVIEHRDSLGNHAFVHPGDVQKMTAGSGIWHSQMNASMTETDRHLQVWLRPRTAAAPPGIDQRRFDWSKRIGRWQALITPDGLEGSLPVDQDASVHAAILHPDHVLQVPARPDRSMYMHVVDGVIKASTLDGDAVVLGAGDALAMARAVPLRLDNASPGTEVLLFDLPLVE
jgi:redox-sensitive bicupin YhaK (pirin superfamily)